MTGRNLAKRTIREHEPAGRCWCGLIHGGQGAAGLEGFAGLLVRLVAEGRGDT